MSRRPGAISPGGKRQPPDEKQIERIKNMHEAGVSKTAIAKLTGRSIHLINLHTGSSHGRELTIRDL